ncbi:MAG TPA: hypothetical protein VMS01_01455 [Stellaceae bacterium]|nr:hypothetical protein [Stellaceae bacterium]
MLLVDFVAMRQPIGGARSKAPSVMSSRRIPVPFSSPQPNRLPQ